MTENHAILLAEVPIGGQSGAIWNRFHGEREDICDALLNGSEPASQRQQVSLRARLRTIDDELDRLMDGSYDVGSMH